MSSHICPVCDKQFSASGTVHDHAWKMHGVCYHCGEQFDTEETLYTHWLTSHSDKLSRVEHKRAEATVDSLAFTERLSNQGISAAVGSLQRRTLLLAGGVAIVGGAAAVGTTLTKGNDTSGNGKQNSKLESETGQSTALDSRTGAVATAPIPPSPDNRRYAVMGPADADVTVTYFGSWKCPHCARFSTGFLSTLVTDYVIPGKIILEYRNVTYANGKPFLGPDAPAAGRAGLAIWNNVPKSYWAFHEYIMANLPSESKQWATADRLASFAQKAGVPDPGVVRTAIQETKYEDALRATSNAAAKARVQGTPVLLIDGTTVSPLEKDRTRRLIDKAIA